MKDILEKLNSTSKKSFFVLTFLQALFGYILASRALCPIEKIEESMVTKKNKILIVDDPQMIRRIVTMILKEYNFEVLTAENGLVGYEMAKANRPDLIIMDVTMPVMSGIEATVKIKADPELSHIPVLIFTSLGGEDDIRTAQEIGVAGFLNKPISKEEMRSTISALLSDNNKS